MIQNLKLKFFLIANSILGGKNYEKSPDFKQLIIVFANHIKTITSDIPFFKLQNEDFYSMRGWMEDV